MYNSRDVHAPCNRRNVEYAYITCERNPVQSSHIQVMYDVFAYALSKLHIEYAYSPAQFRAILRAYLFLHLFFFEQTLNRVMCGLALCAPQTFTFTLVRSLLDKLFSSAQCVRRLNDDIHYILAQNDSPL